MKKHVSQRTEAVLRKVIDYLAEEPKRLNMGGWGNFLPPGTITIEALNKEQEAPPCGTVGCVGGTCLLVSKAGMDFLKAEGCVKEDAKVQTVQFPYETEEKAQSILGITKKQAQRLFYFKSWNDREHGWPTKFARNYTRAKTPKGRFLATKARIEYFIKTGE